MSKPPNNPPAPQPQTPAVAKAKVTAQFSGPIPPPALLQQYDAVVPGAAQRILAMAEEDARHLQQMERIALTGEQNEARRGQIFGIVATLSALATAVIALILGHDTAAIAIGSTTIVSLATIFVVGRVARETK